MECYFGNPNRKECGEKSENPDPEQFPYNRFPTMPKTANPYVPHYDYQIMHPPHFK